MNYRVLTEESKDRSEAAKELERKVEELLNEGWNLYGGVSITVSPHGYADYYILAQAMVK